MSKLIDNIEAKLTGRRHILPEEIKVSFDERDAPDRTSPFNYGTEYRIGINWNYSFVLNNESSGIEKEMAIENVVHSFKDAIYSDIRKQMLHLERSILNGDRDEALKQMRDIMREIY